MTRVRLTDEQRKELREAIRGYGPIPYSLVDPIMKAIVPKIESALTQQRGRDVERAAQHYPIVDEDRSGIYICDLRCKCGWHSIDGKVGSDWQDHIRSAFAQPEKEGGSK